MREISAGEGSPAYLRRLSRLLSDEYALPILEITAAPRGFFGETWKVRTAVGCYFLKIDRWRYHQESYRRSLKAMAYMTAQGISHIPALRKTVDGRLSCSFDGGVLAVFTFEEGIHTEDYPVERLFAHLIPIYRLDASGLGLEEETFGTEILDRLKNLWDAKGLPDSVKRGIEGRKERLTGYVGRLKLFSGRCTAGKEESADFHITHGDAGGNCILNGDRFVIMDWDSVKLAPAERDAWFFLCDGERIAAISRQLEEQGPGRALRLERLCYYCYASYFYYLAEYMENILAAGEQGRRRRMEKALEDYLTDNWIYGQLGIADTVA